MATVSVAEDLKHHGKVAVQVLRPELTAVRGAERFRKEIEITAHLSHPDMLPLFDSRDARSFLRYGHPQASTDPGHHLERAPAGSHPPAHQRVDDAWVRQRRDVSQIVDVTLGDLA